MVSRRFKRASLSLSINAIVVLILAITILGLGLGFIKKQFGGMSDRFDTVNVEMQKELTDKIRTSGELLVFNVLSLDVTRGVENTFYTGISNTDPGTRCFTMLLSCIKSLTPIGNGMAGCDGQDSQNMLAGGAIPPSLQGTGNYPTTTLAPLWFKVFTDVNIPASDVGVYPINVQVGGVKPDTYLMEVVVFKYNQDCDGTIDPSPNPTWSEFQRKQFYIKLK
jgi:hypothetical protein